MTHLVAAFADIIPPPPPPPPPDGGLPAAVWVAFGLGVTAAVAVAVFLWRRTPAPTTPVSR